MASVMVTIRYAGDVNDLFPKWERAVELWQREFGDRFAAPDTIVARGENGDLVIVNVFPDDDARKAAWKKFGPDPEWQALKAKPGFSDKEIIRKITNILMTPAPYSEI